MFRPHTLFVEYFEIQTFYNISILATKPLGSIYVEEGGVDQFLNLVLKRKK